MNVKLKGINRIKKSEKVRKDRKEVRKMLRSERR